MVDVVDGLHHKHVGCEADADGGPVEWNDALVAKVRRESSQEPEHGGSENQRQVPIPLSLMLTRRWISKENLSVGGQSVALDTECGDHVNEVAESGRR